MPVTKSNIAQVNSDIMSLTQFLLLAVLDLVGVFFNVRMLLCCFKDKTKYKLPQKCKGLLIFQCVCQFGILITGAVETWRRFQNPRYNPGQPCDVVKLLSISFMFVQAFNLTTILSIDSERLLATQDRCSKLKITAAVSPGLIASLMIWWFTCHSFPHGYISPTVFITVQLIFLALIIILLLATGFKYIKDFEDATSEASIDCEELWKICNENKRPILFIISLLLCLVVVIYSSLLDREKYAIMVKDFEIVYAFIVRFVVGIVLPVTLRDLIQQSNFGEVKAVETMFV